MSAPVQLDLFGWSRRRVRTGGALPAHVCSVVAPARPVPTQLALDERPAAHGCRWSGWQRVGVPRGKCDASWRHVSGWTLSHCGHPTANWPWDLRDPSGEQVRTGVLYGGTRHTGYAWRTLDDAMAWVARQLFAPDEVRA